MKKFFTLLGGLLLASSLTVNAEEVTVYISDEDGNEIAYNFDADLTKDDDGVYTLANLFKTSDTTLGIPFSFKFNQPEVGKSSPIEVTSNIAAISGYDGYYYIKNSNNKYPVFWIYDLNGIDDWVRLRYSFIYLGSDGSSVYRFDKSDPDNKYDYVATLMISGTFNGYNSETEEYDKELFTGEGEEDPWLYVEFWFNEPTTEEEENPVTVTDTFDVTVYNDAYYYPDYDDEETYTEKEFKPFNTQLEAKSDGSYTLKNIFGTDNSISYTIGKYNPKNIALLTFTDNIKATAGYESYPYFLTPDGKYITVTVEDENGEKLEVDYLSGNEGSDYSYIKKSSDAEIAEGYDEYYVYLCVSGFVGDAASVDMYLSFGYNLKTNAVGEVEINHNAPVEYYNLNGQRVTDPSNGLFIRKQGSKTSKVVIR